MITKLKVGSKTYTIQYDNLIADENTRGLHYGDSGIIKIDPKMPKDSQNITLLHEVLHACLHFIGMDDKDKYSEEEICTKLSPILHTVLKENSFLNK